MRSLSWSLVNRYKVLTVFFFFFGVFGYVPLWGQNIDFTPAKPDGPANIQSALWELATPRAGKPTRDMQDTVVVILVPHLGQASAAIDTSSLAVLGGKVLAQSKSLMRISVPSSSLLAVSELPGVRFVRKPHRPHSQQETWSEGRRLIKAYDNYYAGVRGQGIKVAVIDEGFKGADELFGLGEMPAFWWMDYTGEGIYAGEEVHGTACAEIVHDMAPEAELTLLKVDDLVDLENAKDLCIREGIDIISHSMGWFGTGVGDGKGIACDIVNDAADNGILWVNSAGNSAKSHYYQPWADSDSDGWHNFVGQDELLTFEAEKGTEIAVYLTWNDWPETRDDYDLYLFYSSNSFGDRERVAESRNDQPRYGGPPVEWIEYEAERSGNYHISVRKSEEARSRRLKIWSFNRNLDFEYSSSEGSVAIPADAVGAMSVGAIAYADYNPEPFFSIVNGDPIESYSSRGPTLDGRTKPELMAPTGVSTVSYGSAGFYGTSAAAPHVAGAAALIKSANPSYSRTQLWNALVDATVDIGPRGRDNDSGYGKLVLPIMQVSSSPRITSVSPRQVQYNQVVTVTGNNFGSSRGSSTVRVGPIAISSSALAGWTNTRIRFRVPTNVRSGSVTVRTSAGTSNAVRLEVTSPYLSSVSPTRVNPGDLLTLTGSNFGRIRSSSYVLFTPNVWPTANSDYVTWSDSRIVVKVPAGAQSGDVKVVTGGGSSGTKRIIVEGEVVESLPSRGLFGYSPPVVSKNPKSAKFGFRATNSNLACYFSVKEISDGEIAIFFNEQYYADIPASMDWTDWYLVLDRADLRSGTNIVEFRNVFNQNRTSSFYRWQLKDVAVGEPPSAKPVAGTRILAKVSDGLVSGLGDPFPTPFNAEATIPFALAEAGPVRLAVYNLMGQQTRMLADGWVAAGAHRVSWNGRTDMGIEAASGVYWVVLQVGDAVQTAKLALIR